MGCSGSSDQKQNEIINQIGGPIIINEIIDKQIDLLLHNSLLKQYFQPLKEKKLKIGLKRYLMESLQTKTATTQYRNHLGIVFKQEEFNIYMDIFKSVIKQQDKQIQDTMMLQYKSHMKSLILPHEERKTKQYQIEEGVSPDSIYAKIGGMPSVVLAVSMFYERILDDKLVDHFFKNTDMQKQEERQVEFLVLVFGGPNIYKGKDMLSVHRGMNIQGIHFDRIVELLAGVLTELGVPGDIIGEIANIAASVKYDVCGVYGAGFEPKELTQSENIKKQNEIQQKKQEQLELKEEENLKNNMINSNNSQLSAKEAIELYLSMREEQLISLEMISLNKSQELTKKNEEDNHKKLDQMVSKLQIKYPVSPRQSRFEPTKDRINTLLISDNHILECKKQQLLNTSWMNSSGNKKSTDNTENFHDLFEKSLQSSFNSQDINIQIMDHIESECSDQSVFITENDHVSNDKSQRSDLKNSLNLKKSQNKDQQEEQKQSDQVKDKKPSIYDRIGGMPSVKLAVEIFYDKILDDEHVNHFFLNTDMQKQEERQIEFLVLVFGGPDIYKGKDLYTAHKGMNIKKEHFDKIVQLLAETLAGLGVPNDIIGEIADIAASVQQDIIDIK